MAAPFISKSRRVRFELSLHILDLNNVPLVSGTSFIKWHLPSSTAAEHRGRTPKNPIRDHRVQYDYTKNIPVRLTVGKDGMLQDCTVEFEVLQEYSAGGRGERITLGHVRCNLAEYVDASEPSPGGAAGAPLSPTTTNTGKKTPDGSDMGVVRRYLMQDSKINSTLKLGIGMRYIEGTRDYYAPALRTAPVFGGIAGIISSSEPAATTNQHHSTAAAHSDTDGDNSNGGGATTMPSLSASSREMGEMQDMYRRTLAAFWASQPGELKADECIEDIFAGGDGWGKHGRPGGHHHGKGGAGDDGNATPRGAGGSRSGSGAQTPVDGSHGLAEDANTIHGLSGKLASHQSRSTSGGSHHQQAHKGSISAAYRSPHHHSRLSKTSATKDKSNAASGLQTRGGSREIDESEVRDDLRSWWVGEVASAVA